MGDDKDLTSLWCRGCKEHFYIKQSMYDRFEESGETFCCPLGHRIVLSREYIVRQLRNAGASIRSRNINIVRLTKLVESLKGVQTRQRNRLLRGVCPYCGKTSTNMIKHVQRRHGPKRK